MAQNTIVINGDRRILDRIAKIDTFTRNPKKAMSKTGDFLINEFDKNFDEEGARLEKSKWKALKASTIEQRLRLGFGPAPILQRTGKLKSGFKKQVRRSSVRVHNPVPYFKYHQRGDKPQPKRTMISTPDRLKQEIVEIFRRVLDTSLRGRL